METLAFAVLCLVATASPAPQYNREGKQLVPPSVVQPQLVHRGSYVQPQLFMTTHTYSPGRRVSTVHHYAHPQSVSYGHDTHIVHHSGVNTGAVSPSEQHHHVYSTVPNQQSQQTISQLVPSSRAVVLARSQDINTDGSYSYGFQSDNGISVEANASPITALGPDDAIQTVRGSYSYTAPDGTPIVTHWIADENGFRAEGSHLPKAPELDYKAAR